MSAQAVKAYRATRALVATITCAITIVGLCYLGLLGVVLVRPFSRRRYRYMMSHVEEAWVLSLTLLLGRAHPLYMSGDLDRLQRSDSPKIVICNHQADCDWWYLWLLAGAFGRTGRVKVILKAAVLQLPIVGWGARFLEFIPLQRNWATDREPLMAALGSYADDGFPLWLVIFPEGTTVHAEAVARSRAFAAKSEPPRPAHDLLLLPRTRGFEAALQGLATCRPEVVDVTLAFDGYSGEVPSWDQGYSRQRDRIPTWYQLLSGQGPAAVHMRVCVSSFDDVSANPAAWLDAAWVAKEQALRGFIATKRLPQLGMGTGTDTHAGKGSSSGSGSGSGAASAQAAPSARGRAQSQSQSQSGAGTGGEAAGVAGRGDGASLSLSAGASASAAAAAAGSKAGGGGGSGHAAHERVAYPRGSLASMFLLGAVGIGGTMGALWLLSAAWAAASARILA